MGSLNSGAKRGGGSGTDAILPVNAKRPEKMKFSYIRKCKNYVSFCVNQYALNVPKWFYLSKCLSNGINSIFFRLLFWRLFDDLVRNKTLKFYASFIYFIFISSMESKRRKTRN